MDVNLVLVIILSAALFILLLLSIVAAAIAITILRQVRRITSRAEATTETFSNIFLTVGKRVAPMALSGVAATVIRQIRKSMKNKKDKED